MIDSAPVPLQLPGYAMHFARLTPSNQVHFSSVPSHASVVTDYPLNAAPIHGISSGYVVAAFVLVVLLAAIQYALLERVQFGESK